MFRRARCIAFLLVFALSPLTITLAKGPVYDDPAQAKADEDFAIQGEYSGEIETEEGKKLKHGVQVIALGEGSFLAASYHGGLPGDGARQGDRKEYNGKRENGKVAFSAGDGKGVIENGVLSIYNDEGERIGQLQRVERKSPTLGEKPPQGAVVLFDGKSAAEFPGGKMTDDGLLMQGCTSEKKFGDHRLHLEFRLPYQPQDRGQARGNSGIYLQGRYEVQMLDSFGLEGKHNECGGIYTVKDPAVNMCLPPLAWQTYDIDYTAAKYDESGKLKANPRVTVRHNGVVIHDDVELPGERNTTAAPVSPGPEPGPIYLQDHGNPVRYRNIWVVPKG